MIGILLTGSLRSPPPIRLRRTSPYSGGRIKHLEASLRKRIYSKHGLLCHLAEGERWSASHQRGNTGVVHEVYDSLFFSSNFLFPLEGKCHVVAKGCTGQSNDVILYRYPDHQSTASIATSWSSPPLQAGGTRFNKCSCKGFIIRGRLLSIHRRPPPPFEPSEPFEPERRRRLNPQARQGLSIRRVNLREYSHLPQMTLTALMYLRPG